MDAKQFDVDFSKWTVLKIRVNLLTQKAEQEKTENNGNGMAARKQFRSDLISEFSLQLNDIEINGM